MVKLIKKIKRRNIVILLITIGVYLGNIMCVSLNQVSEDRIPAGEKRFAGSASCASCHNEIYKSDIQTAHYLDSRPASKEFIKGSFARNRNEFVYNKWTKVVMEQKKDRFFQAAMI